MFSGLHVLLKVKTELAAKGQGCGIHGAGFGQGGRITSGGGVDEAYLKAIDAQTRGSSRCSGRGRGGGAPDIMTLDKD